MTVLSSGNRPAAVRACVVRVHTSQKIKTFLALEESCVVNNHRRHLDLLYVFDHPKIFLTIKLYHHRQSHTLLYRGEIMSQGRTVDFRAQEHIAHLLEHLSSDMALFEADPLGSWRRANSLGSQTCKCALEFVLWPLYSSLGALRSCCRRHLHWSLTRWPALQRRDATTLYLDPQAPSVETSC